MEQTDFTPYHKIHSLFKRNPETHRFMLDQWARPEFEYLQYNQWIFREKIDGTNIRLGYHSEGDILVLGGRTDKAKLPQSLKDRFYEKFSVEKMRKVFTGDAHVVLYCEGYGKKIQKVGSRYIPDGVDFILFDIKVGSWWLKWEDVVAIGEALGIQTVPVIGSGTLHDAIDIVKNGFPSRIGEVDAEGLVVIPKYELHDRAHNRIIAKVKTCDFRE